MTTNPIDDACRLLREGAAQLRNCHTLAATGHDWTGEPEAKAAYDEHMATADALERVHAECEALRTGYAAARLEIESLRARSAEPAVREAVAKAIYDQWVYKDGWVAWVNGGNSLRQDDARRLADLAFAMAQAAPELTETAVTAKNPAAPVSSFEDSRTQAVYEVLVNDNYPPAGSGEHWEGWKARLIVDALFPIEAPAAVAVPKKWAPEEVEDGERGIRWVTNEGIHGRPTDHDVREYLNRTPTAKGCLCDECKVFYAAAPTTQPAPQQEAPADELEEVLRERDEAEDFINELLDEVLGADRPELSSAYNLYDAMNDVRERITALHKPAVDKAWGRFESAMAAPQPSPVAQGDALDAARYRWLREQPFDTWKRIAWNTWNNDPVVWPDRDAAIDAARTAQEGDK